MSTNEEFVEDRDYTTPFADGIILMPTDNLAWKMIFYHKRFKQNQDGHIDINNIVKELKFEVRVPFEVISNLYEVIHDFSRNTPTLPKDGKNMKQDEIRGNEFVKYSQGYFTKTYDTDHIKDTPEATKAKFRYMFDSLYRV
jgi:hypothetical protein